MTVHTISSRDFTRDVKKAKEYASQGPVFITVRGKPEYALLRIEDYHQLAAHEDLSLLELMDGIAGGEGIEFEPEKLTVAPRAAKLR
jgi:hypothetical protein